MYPELFEGIISYFGPVQMASNPLNQARQMDLDTLRSYRHSFVCGNRDIYKIGIFSIPLNHLLSLGEGEHFFELEEGEHDSRFSPLCVTLPQVCDRLGRAGYTLTDRKNI